MAKKNTLLLTPEQLRNLESVHNISDQGIKMDALIHDPSLMDPEQVANLMSSYSANDGRPRNTVLPVITGTPTVGQVLTSDTGTWINEPDSYTYQWKRAGVAITGETNSTYTVVEADVDQSITVTVTATNIAGSTSATSEGVIGEMLEQATAPSPVIANSLDTSTVNLYWSNTGADNYVVKRNTVDNEASATQIYSGAYAIDADNKDCQFHDSGLTMGQRYYYWVKGQEAGKADSEWATDNVQTISFMPLAWYEGTGIEYNTDNEYGSTVSASNVVATLKSIVNTSGPTVTPAGAGNLVRLDNNANFGYNVLLNSSKYGDLDSDINLTGDFTICMAWWVSNIPVNARVFTNKNSTEAIRFNDLNTVQIDTPSGSTILDWPSDLVIGHRQLSFIERSAGIIRISLDGGSTWATAGSANTGTVVINRLFGSNTGGNLFSGYIERLVISDQVLSAGQRDEVFNYLKRPAYTPESAEAPAELVLPEGVTWSDMPANNTIVDSEIDDVATGSHGRERVLVKGKYAAILYHENNQDFMVDKLLVWDLELNKYCIAYTFPILPENDDDVHNSGDIFEYDGRWWHVEQQHYDGTPTNTLRFRSSNKGYNLFEFNPIQNAKGVATALGRLNNYHQFNTLGDTLLMYTQNWNPTGYAEWVAAWTSSDRLNYFDKNRIADTGAPGTWFYFHTPHNGLNNVSVLFLNYYDVTNLEYPYCFALKTTNGYTFTNLSGSFSKDVRNGNAITLAELIANCVFTTADSGKDAFVHCSVMDATGEVSGIAANGSNTGFDWFTIETDGAVTKKAMDFGGRNVLAEKVNALADLSLVYWKVSDQEKHAVVYEDNGDGLWQLAHYKTMDNGETTEFVGIISNDSTKKFQRMVMNKSNPYDDYVIIAATIEKAAAVPKEGSLWLHKIDK